jgi:hypothetical protein
MGQTYLTLFKISTIALTINGWVLSAAQFDVFKAGGITEAELDAAAFGTGTNQIWARTSVTGQDPVRISHLNIYMNAGEGVNATLSMDEFRLSNFSLNEVTPVPEPSGVALILLGAGLLGSARKRS